MGTEVSQIACGKKHTLALLPSRGRLYSFGLGGCGQLGNNSFTRLVNICLQIKEFVWKLKWFFLFKCNQSTSCSWSLDWSKWKFLSENYVYSLYWYVFFVKIPLQKYLVIMFYRCWRWSKLCLSLWSKTPRIVWFS